MPTIPKKYCIIIFIKKLMVFDSIMFEHPQDRISSAHG